MNMLCTIRGGMSFSENVGTHVPSGRFVSQSQTTSNWRLGQASGVYHLEVRHCHAMYHLRGRYFGNIASITISWFVISALNWSRTSSRLARLAGLGLGGLNPPSA